MKAFKTLLPVALLLIIVGCSQKKIPAPEMDLHTAVVMNNIDVIKEHIQAGSDLNAKEPSRQSTPLLTAAVLGRTDAALALIDGGADLDYQNSEGSTALITAAFFCRKNIVRALLDKGADPSIRNKAGRTALDSVKKPFDEVKPIYDALGAALAPLGLTLDYATIEATRPVIAQMLEQAS